ncbi:DUF4190 domain-containing protein [Streptomyces sp. NPDC048441]|uniref:DUF4190 domain-containing protein n=1 Tax=Streptomyces sp. NPDC048441 TaxID=3365552 RepID=UPI0037190573
MALTATTTKPSATAPSGAAAPSTPAPTGRRDTDGMAVASFVLGLLGLLVLNLFLGPIAIVLAGIALLRGTSRKGRAILGLGLGVADLVVLAALMSMDNTVSWGLAG